jgi:hypothetical protein
MEKPERVSKKGKVDQAIKIYESPHIKNALSQSRKQSMEPQA